MIILDFETNSAAIHDVIEVAAFRIKREEGVYVITDKFCLKPNDRSLVYLSVESY